MHSERLQTGCARLGLPCPQADALLAKLETTIATATIETGFAAAKLTVAAGTAGRGYQRDPRADPSVSGGDENEARVWGVESGREIKQLAGHTRAIEFTAFSPDGKLLATASWDGTIKLWDTTTWKASKRSGLT